MSIKRLSYKDIPKPVRARAATEAQRRLQATLSDPVMTAEQREAARQQQEVLRQWTAGTLPNTAISPEPSSPELSLPEPTTDGGSAPESSPDSAPQSTPPEPAPPPED